MSQRTFTSRLYASRHNLALFGTFALAVFFRFWQLGSTPPGLSAEEAASGHAALAVIKGTTTLAQLLHNGAAHSLITLIQAASIRLIGSTTVGLRLPTAILGTLAVIMVFIWARDWFGRNVALVAALLLAVTPWTVGFSRLGIASAGIMLVVPGGLWLATMAVRTKKPVWQILAGLWLAVAASSVGGLWLLGGLAIVVIPWLAQRKQLVQYVRDNVITIIVTLVIGLPLVYLHFASHHLSVASLSDGRQVAEQASATIGMFNLRGDTDFHYNIAATPELNLFVGLMLVVGLLVSAVRSGKTRYRTLLILLVALLIPAMLQPGNGPNSQVALVAAPLVVTLAAIGIMYMLEVWYGTFPINSAARTLGTIPIVLLLVLSVYQGYKQYFVAWAGSPEVYDAYNTSARDTADYLNRTNFSGQRYILASGDALSVITYLTYGKANFTTINATNIPQLPTGDPQKQVIFLASDTGDIIKDLKARFPKARLSQHYSAVNENSLTFAVYETRP